MNPRLRILLVSSAYRPYPSGVSEHVHHLAQNLTRLGQDVALLTTNFPGPEEPPGPFPVTRVGHAVLIPMNRSYATLPVGLQMAGQVRRFLDRHHFDIVHCHGLFWPELSYWAIRYSRAVNLITILTAGFKLHSRGSRLFRVLFSRHLAKIHGRIAISERARAAVQPYVPGEYRIIPSGIDLERFRPDVTPMVAKDPSRPTILFVGRLDRRKGLDILLRAMGLVLKPLPRARLIVIGSGPMETRCRRLAKELGVAHAVEFRGTASPDDLPRWYASGDVYCSPALGGETLGIVLLEAMATGVPVVATNIPGYDETVRPGIDGLLVPAAEPEPLARNLLQVLQNTELGKRLATEGQKRVRDYAWPLVTQRTLDYYQELLSCSAKSLVKT